MNERLEFIRLTKFIYIFQMKMTFRTKHLMLPLMALSSMFNVELLTSDLEDSRLCEARFEIENSELEVLN